MVKKEVVLIGSGNVATHLALNIAHSEYLINTIYSNSTKNARILAKKTNSSYSDDLLSIPNDNLIYILSVTDSALEDLCNEINFDNGIVLHTSGSIDMSVLKSVSKRYGILYPLQTFSKTKELDISKVPFFIEASDNETLSGVKDLAFTFSSNVIEANSCQRKILHLTAVFVSNFTNHMYSIAEEILDTEGLDFDILKPLIKETIEKALIGNPKESQTGPAVREDHKVIDKHLQLLEDKPEFREIYKLVSESIIRLKKIK